MSTRTLTVVSLFAVGLVHCSEPDGATDGRAGLAITILDEPCGDWDSAVATEASSVPDDPLIPYVKWVYTLWDEPRVEELMVRGQLLQGSASIDLSGSICLPIVGAPESAGCIRNDGRLDWLEAGYEPWGFAGAIGVAIAPDGSHWWRAASGTLYQRGSDGEFRAANLGTDAANDLVIGPNGVVAGLYAVHGRGGVAAVSRCMRRVWEAELGTSVIGATEDGFWLRRSPSLSMWLVSPAGEVLAELEPPDSVAAYDFASFTTVSNDRVLHLFHRLSPDEQSIAGAELYLRRRPEWQPEYLGAPNWTMIHYGGYATFRALADGPLVGSAPSSEPPVAYEVWESNGRQWTLEPPGSHAAAGPLLGGDGALVVVRDMTDYSVEPPNRGTLVLVYESDGTERESLLIEGVTPTTSEAAALGRDGTLYFGATVPHPQGRLSMEAVVSVQTDVPGGPADGWTQARGDARASRSTLRY